MKLAVNASFKDRTDTGSGQYLLHLARELAKPANSVELQLFEPPSQSNLAKLRFEQIGFPNAARKSGADLAHVPYFGPALFARLPTVVTIHDLIPIVLPAYRGSPKVRAYTRLASAAARRAQAIIADSLSSQHDIVRLLGIPADNVRVIYLAADESYRPVTEAAQLNAVRARYGLPEQFVLYLGGFDQRKNVPNLLHAYTKVARGMGPDCPLIIGGRLPSETSPLFPDVQQLVKRLDLADIVGFIGPVDELDKPALYTLAACFAWPSWYEGFGLPVLEAMACGTPVVAGNRGSLPEIVGDAGFLVEPDDINRMAGAIIASVIDEPLRREHRAKGLAQAAKFSWQKCAAETIEVYRQVLQRSAAGPELAQRRIS
jgi:glycosyltransferase involved in cell wall biosynthesis